MDADQQPYKHSDLTDRSIGCFYPVYGELGFGFLESVYERALLVELRASGLSAEAQVPLTVRYHGETVGEFRANIVVEQAVIVELKAVHRTDPIFDAQLLNYLKATDIEVGLLLNFGPKPQIKRLAFENTRK